MARDWFSELEARANVIEGLSTTSSSKYDEFKAWLENELGGHPAVCFLSELTKQWTPRVGQALMGMPKALVLLVRGSGVGDANERLSALHQYATGLHATIVLIGDEGEWKVGLVAGNRGRGMYERLAGIRPDLAGPGAGISEGGAGRPDATESTSGRRRDFLAMDPPDQGDLIWERLIGQGPLEVDEAIRAAANALRDDGWLAFERLRRDGPVYAAIEEAISWCARRGLLFDRPARGYVRATISDVDGFQRDHWRSCILRVIEGERMDRDELVRASAEWAVRIYGLDMQRLRSGGRIDTAIRGAINGLLRLGHLERHGAQWLRRATLASRAEDADGNGYRPDPLVGTPMEPRAEAGDVVAPVPDPPAAEAAERVEKDVPSVAALRAMIGDVPGETEAILAQLLALPLKRPSDLEDAVAKHVRAFEDAFSIHQFLDLTGAEQLAGDSRRILDRWPELSEPEKHLAQAAILYFVESDEADDDFRIGGLRTDKIVMAAISRVVLHEPRVAS